ncbi:TetR/AcrR family transcriptional regulator [Streptomyces boninensis]|uniref:TetR/AcrR family transcriptional regulator n=1 Tax=Streptomyces boninensis TaxID=2039455 RepID=UPI003B21468C
MARWDPGTAERLRKAALELFGERGYEQVTVTQIAERAGITRRSFFRYYPDKREVLFAGSEQLPPAVAAAVLAADPDAAPLAAVLDALAPIGSRLVADVDHIAERRAVINASPELQERERTKTAAVGAAIRDALGQRGVADDSAKLVAQLATLIFQNAFERWIKTGGEQDFADSLDEIAASVRESVAGMGESPGD